MGYRIEASKRGVVAVCGCGWRTQRLSSAGLAGATWDRHHADEHQGEPCSQ